MKYERTWAKWTYWSFGIHRYGTTISKNMQIAIGPLRVEFSERLLGAALSPPFGQMRRESSGRIISERSRGHGKV